MEARILAAEQNIARIEALFASSDFHRTHATQTNQLNEELIRARAEMAGLFLRWEELEAIRVSGGK